MSKLPVANHPTTTIILPSSGEKLKVRPYTVGDQKNIMLPFQEIADALETGKMPDDMDDSVVEDIIDAVLALIQKCVVQPEDFDARTMMSFDAEYVFLRLYGMSSNNILKMTLNTENVCLSKEEKKPCMEDDQQIVRFAVNVDDISIEANDAPYKFGSIEKKIDVDLECGHKISFNRPTASSMKLFQQAKDPMNSYFTVIAENLNSVVDENGTVYTDFSVEEAFKYIGDTITEKDSNKSAEFFQSEPSIILRKEVVCTKCGYKENLKFNRLADFLG